uniref:Uncharacterized protein n=1 Tax=Panagrolaimus sp. PS1159 TaxID=55785 RepID=A0AC35FWZ1_9BILA
MVKCCGPVAKYSSSDPTLSENRKIQTLNKTSESCSNYLTVINEAEEKVVKRWKKCEISDSISSSTLSLHISICENSFDNVSNQFGNKKETSLKVEKFKSIKASTFVIQNLFEFPRQQNNETSHPESSQFRASQRLINPLITPVPRIHERRNVVPTTAAATPLQQIRSTSPATAFGYNYNVFNENSSNNWGETPRRPITPARNRVEPAAKRARVEPIDYVEMIRDRFMILQEDSLQVKIVNVTDKDSFANCELTVIQRANLEVGDIVHFINDSEVPVMGTVVFVGKKIECEEYLKSYENSPLESEQQNLIGNSGIEELIGKVDAMTNRMEELSSKVEDMATNIASLNQRVLVLEGKKAAKSPKPKPQTSLLQTVYHGVGTVISSIPNYPNYLLQKTLQYQSESSPILVNDVDIRPQLYLNRNFFISNFNKPNDAGLGLLYILVGPQLANNVFLPQVFYDIGPSARSGTAKTSLSYKATYTWYQALDLMLTNVFIHKHRHLFIAKARNFVNQNVNTRTKYPNRNLKHFKNLIMAPPLFSPEQSTVANFLEEKERIRGTEEVEAVITWANSLGIEDKEGSDTEGAYEIDEEDF